MPKSYPVLVVCGGPSAEAEVSRSSGRAVAEALEERFSVVRLLELSRQLPAELAAAEDAVVFPVLHGPPGEDGCFQGLLELLQIPYVGSGVLASALAMDKVVAKKLFASAGLPLVPDFIADATTTPQQIVAALGPRVVLKPAGQGSALGVRICRDESEVGPALVEGLRFGPQLLCERFIEGDEVTVAVLDEEPDLPVCLIRTPGESWYDYEHRYTPGLSEHVVPAPFTEGCTGELQRIARAAHQALGCRDLSRADFVLDAQGAPYLLEVNTLPGMTPTSLLPDIARAGGLDFPELTERLVRRARARAPQGERRG